MQHLHRLVPWAAAALGVLVAAPAEAAPTTPSGHLLGTTVTASKAAPRACHTTLRAPGAGVVHRRVTSPSLGLLQARLAGRGRGDWDLGVFNRRGRAVAGSAHFGTREVAEGFVGRNQVLTVQACRRAGSVRRVRLTVDHIPVPRATPGEKVLLARVLTPTHEAKNRLTATGLDVTEHGRETYLDVVLYGARDVARLKAEGFQFQIVNGDMFAATRAALAARATTRRGQSRSHQGQSAPSLPSGRTNYRRLADYSADLKRLAEQHPDLVKLITLPHPTREGRPVEGAIIAKDPGTADGRPAFLQMGVHHAREWPSGEHAIEWAFELVNGYGKDERTTRLMETTKTIVVPLVNPDGFNLTREMPFANANLDPVASGVPVDSAQPVVDPGYAYKRRNCRIVDYTRDTAGTPTGYAPVAGGCAANRRLGVDPNRNYGGLWGGPGATHDPRSDIFYGEGPFSEPETQNVRHLVSTNQVTTLITNHTYSDLILRPPGVKATGDAHDEEVYAHLGQSMADENGYSNWKSYQLYDTTGTTEDWSYYATGGLGFTFEIGRAASSRTNDVRTGESTSDLGLAIAGSYAAVGFHPAYPVGVISEWNGKGPHVGKGNREAYFAALEATADTAKHSVIRGRAKPGTTLTLTKTFETKTSPRGSTAAGLPVYDPDGTRESFTDTLQTSMVVPASGRIEWHVNPSTRPEIAKGAPGRAPTGPTTPDFTIAHDPQAQFVPGLSAASAGAPGTYEDREFEILSQQDNASIGVEITWPGEGTVVAGNTTANVSDEDLDLYLLRQDPATGAWLEVAHSGAGSGTREALTVPTPPPGKYRVRVANYLTPADDDKAWSGAVSFTAPSLETAVPPAKEAWSLTCTTPDGDVGTESVVVDRGEVAEAALRGCGGGKPGKPKPKPKPKG